MRVLIISDVHANVWALRAVLHDAGAVDHVLCAGDSVNYGPDPRATLDTLRAQGVVAVRGNHDQAVAWATDPRASPAKQPLALALREWTRSQLEPTDSAWLVRLPLRLTWEIAGTRFALLHATARDPLYDYRLRPDAPTELFREATAGVDAEVLVLGHTHWPLVRACGDLHVVNPGSVGQPLDGDPRAAYAIWQDGEMTLRRAAYDQTRMLAAVDRLPIDPPLRDTLGHILRRGRID